MNISLLLRELSAHEVGLEPDGLSLPAPNWPDHCPKELRQAFAQNRRGIMARIAPPVFVHMQTQSPDKASATSTCHTHNEVFEQSVVLVQVDDEIVIWLPGLGEEGAKRITRRLGLQQRGINPDRVQIATDRSLPSILRRAVRSGRAFCGWDSQNREAAVWHAMRFPAPLRWIDLRDLARAGGRPENFDDLSWNLLSVLPARESPLPTCGRTHGVHNEIQVIDQWTTRIRAGLNRLLGVADLYDRLKQHDEPELVAIHQGINRFGIGLDVERAKAVLNLATEYAKGHLAGVTEATNGTMTAANLLDDGYVLSWLQAWGLNFPNLSAETIQWLQSQMRSAGLRHTVAVEAVLDARLLLARQPIGSLRRALELVDHDARIRNHMVYFANRVGEFASQGIAFSTLASLAATDPSPSDFPRIPTVDELITDRPGGTSIEKTLSSMVADCFVPAEGHAFEIYHWPHLKAAVLNWMAGKPSPPASSINTVRLERTRRALAQEVRDALDGERTVKVGQCELGISSAAIEICLPSGRMLYYREVISFRDERAADESPTPLRSPAPTLRARLNEHAVLDEMIRAIRRDVIATALQTCVEVGARVVAHGPDVLITEVDSKSRDGLLLRLLEEPPEWARGLQCNGKRIRTARLGGGHNLMCPEQATEVSILF